MSQQVLERLVAEWMFVAEHGTRRRNETRAGDLLLAALLLAQEDRQFLEGRPKLVFEAVELCGEHVDSYLDRLPLQAIQGYWLIGRPYREVVEGISCNLAHHNSAIRLWFHQVAWMMRPDLDVERVRPLLLKNLADKIWRFTESAGLLANLHPDESVLNAAADAFLPPEGFEDQYRSRLAEIREAQWTAQPLNLWVEENFARKLIWETVKSMEIEP
jgi:hypothetical protein